MNPAMPFWSREQRVSRRRAEERADQLLFDFGDDAYSEARRYEREAYGLEAAAYWRYVSLAIARKTKKPMVVGADKGVPAEHHRRSSVTMAPHRGPRF